MIVANPILAAAVIVVAKTVELHTMPAYTGVGATLPNVLPPQSQCGPGNRGWHGAATKR